MQAENWKRRHDEEKAAGHDGEALILWGHHEALAALAEKMILARPQE